MYKKKNSWQKFWTERNLMMLKITGIVGFLEGLTCIELGIWDMILFGIFAWQFTFWLFWFIFGDHSPVNK